MEQRRLRLGDILDDYCPRERRVTNHAVVAMVEEDVKQTRCTTCDTEHVYKGGRAPRTRRKDSTSVLYREVLAGMPDVEGAPAAAAVAAVAYEPAPVPLPVNMASDAEPVSAEPLESAPTHDEQPEPETPEREGEGDGPIHRRLIRATLPRPEGQKEVRTVPDFTIRANGARPHGHGGFRGDRTRGQAGGGTNNRSGARRFSGGAGNANGARGGRSGFGGNGRPSGGSRKRSR